MNSGTVVPNLRRAIGAEGRALLNKFSLLSPLVEQMLTCEAIADVAVSEQQLEEARLNLLDQHGFGGVEQWAELLEELESRNEEVLDRLRHRIRRRSFMRERFAPKAEARFLDRKNELDQVVYSLLRLENSFLARELYCRSNPVNPTSPICQALCRGPGTEHQWNHWARISDQAHPALVEKLRVAQPGVLLEPFQISDWWLVVRLERYALQRSPKRFQTRCAKRCSMPGSMSKPPRS